MLMKYYWSLVQYHKMTTFAGSWTTIEMRTVRKREATDACYGRLQLFTFCILTSQWVLPRCSPRSARPCPTWDATTWLHGWDWHWHVIFYSSWVVNKAKIITWTLWWRILRLVNFAHIIKTSFFVYTQLMSIT